MREIAPQVYRPGRFPGPGEARRVVQGGATLDQALRDAFLRGNTTVLLDEVYLVASQHRSPEWMRRVWVAGAERGVGGIAIAQRPRSIPVYLLSEASLVVAFRLQYRPDIDALEANTQVSWEEVSQLENYEWLVWRQGMRSPERRPPIQLVADVTPAREGGRRK